MNAHMLNEMFLNGLIAKNNYTEMSFRLLMTLPKWNGRTIYKYEHALRKDYGLDMSKLFLN